MFNYEKFSLKGMFNLIDFDKKVLFGKSEYLKEVSNRMIIYTHTVLL